LQTRRRLLTGVERCARACRAGLASVNGRKLAQRISPGPHPRPQRVPLMNSGLSACFAAPDSGRKAQDFFCQSLNGTFVFLVPPSHKRDAVDREISFRHRRLPAWPQCTGLSPTAMTASTASSADFGLPPRMTAPTPLWTGPWSAMPAAHRSRLRLTAGARRLSAS